MTVKKMRAKAPALQIKPWVAIALIALIAAGLSFWIDWYRHRFVRSDLDLVRLLPPSDAAIFYIDLKALRRAGVIGVLHQIKFADEARYAAFVRETGFDYTRDADQLAGEARGNEDLYFIGRGRFAWDRLQRYASEHGGSCEASFCRAPTSSAGRWASFSLVQPDVIALIVSKQPVRFEARRKESDMPAQWAPVWVQLSADLLASSSPHRIPLPALWGAKSVTVSARPATNAGQTDFIIRLDAVYPSAQMASIARGNLAIQTKMLSLEFQRNGIPDGAGDISGLLTSGSFRTAGNRAIGTWKVSQGLLRRLE